MATGTVSGLRTNLTKTIWTCALNIETEGLGLKHHQIITRTRLVAQYEITGRPLETSATLDASLLPAFLHCVCDHKHHLQSHLFILLIVSYLLTILSLRWDCLVDVRLIHYRSPHSSIVIQPRHSLISLVLILSPHRPQPTLVSTPSPSSYGLLSDQLGTIRGHWENK